MNDALRLAWDAIDGVAGWVVALMVGGGFVTWKSWRSLVRQKKAEAATAEVTVELTEEQVESAKVNTANMSVQMARDMMQEARNDALAAKKESAEAHVEATAAKAESRAAKDDAKLARSELAELRVNYEQLERELVISRAENKDMHDRFERLQERFIELQSEFDRFKEGMITNGSN